jgi:hypothetical protein
MNRLPKSLIALVAIVAALGILFVLITPAPDELPSVGPHSFHSLFLPASSPTHLSAGYKFTAQSGHESFVYLSIDRLSVTCTRLC